MTGDTFYYNRVGASLSFYAAFSLPPFLNSIDIAGVNVDYVHLPQTAAAEEERIKNAGQSVMELSNKPTTKIRIYTLRITDGSFGYVKDTSCGSVPTLFV